MLIPAPALSSLILFPLEIAILVMAVRDTHWARMLALLASLIECIFCILVVLAFEADRGDFQMLEKSEWIPLLHIQFLLGIDGLSVMFLPGCAILSLMSLLASWNSVQNLSQLHFSLLLILEALMMGAFCALDLVLFYLFIETMLLGIFYLIALWGIGPQRRSAAIKYVLFMLFGSVPILFAIVLIAHNHAMMLKGTIPENLVFSLPELLNTPIDDNLQSLIYILFMLGLAVKAPLAPFHTWLPTLAMEAPAQLSAYITGLPLGIYAMLRFAMTLTPSATVQYSWILGIVGAVTFIYAALIALQQSNLRRLLAYANISQTGLVIIGLSSLTIQGLQGSLMQLLNFSLFTSALMLIAGFIQHRLGSTDVVHLGGLAKVMPRLSCFFFLFALISIGVPGGSVFPSELLLVLGTMSAHPSLGVTALVGSVLTAAYMLTFARKAILGPITHTGVLKLQDLRQREVILLSIPALLLLIYGFLPNALNVLNKSSAEQWLTRLIDQPLFDFSKPQTLK